MRNKGLMVSMLLLTMGMVATLLLTGCNATNPKDNNSEVVERVDEMTPTDDSLVVIGVSQVGSESVWRTANTNSIQETFTTENGYFLIFNNARQKQENQIKAIRGFISQKVDYIVLSPITEEGWDTVLQEAKDAEIPVILFDRKLKVDDPSLYTTWVGSDFHLEGRKAGAWLETYLARNSKNDANIVVLKGTEGSTAEVGRTAGFLEIAQSHTAWKVLAEVDAEYTTTKGKEVMKKLLQDYPELDVVVAQNDDMMFGAIEALHEAGKTTGEGGDVVVISFDACKMALNMIKDGSLNVDVECNPLQGEYIEGIIKDLEEEKYVNRETYIEEMVFDSTNIDEYIENRTY